MDNSPTEFEEDVGKGPGVSGLVVAFLWRSALLGTCLYLLLGSDAAFNLKLNGLSYIVAAVWSYYDGFLRRHRWGMALIEAAPLHFSGVQVGNLLVVAFGSPLDAV